MIPTQPVTLSVFMLCCARCRFWNRESDTEGLCELHLKHIKPKMTIDCGENTIRTEHDFGCVQFEASEYSIGSTQGSEL